MTVLESLIIALSMYSAIPMPQVEWQEKNMRWSLLFLPIVGLIISVFIGVWYYLCDSTQANRVFFAVVATLLPIFISGGFHMDGFLDAADAVFSRRDRERRLEIMKDPHCGPFAVVCCGALWLITAGSWCQLLESRTLMPLACSVFICSRALTVCIGSKMPYASTSRLGILFAERAHSGVFAAGIVQLAIVAAALVFIQKNLAAVSVFAVVSLLLVWLFCRGVKRTFGGVTGDLLGFFIQLYEGVTLTSLAVLSLMI